jgi:hypothetical protein
MEEKEKNMVFLTRTKYFARDQSKEKSTGKNEQA